MTVKWMKEGTCIYILYVFVCVFTGAATDDLVANLQGKSKNYDSPTLQDLFLLNNYHFIHSVFQR